jgi:hypothetical protein
MRGIEKWEIKEALHSPKEGKHLVQTLTGRGTIEICYEKRGNHIKIITVYWV